MMPSRPGNAPSPLVRPASNRGVLASCQRGTCTADWAHKCLQPGECYRHLRKVLSTAFPSPGDPQESWVNDWLAASPKQPMELRLGAVALCPMGNAERRQARGSGQKEPDT